ncbi:MAG: peptidylprolyl isomerase [Gemmatimonadota bacterium]|nr:MAG: peptidylprolyl isomerase [Gemmatimonadota bacterium]
MRQNTKIIMLIVALAFVGLMVFQWGMDISGQSGNAQAGGQIGRVNGTPISYQFWTQTYRNLTDQARDQKGAALNDQDYALIEEQTWNQIVSQILIEQELRRRGIEVTDQEVRLAFQTAPPPWLQSNELFQTGGQFDYEKYRAFFSNPAVDPQLLIQIEQYYRNILPQARLMEQIGSGIYVPDSELWDLYRTRNERVQIRYLVLDPEIIVDDSEVAVTDVELRNFYEENREDFKQPTRADVLTVTFSRTPGASDTAAARARANSIREEILAGASFEEQAEAHSADPGSAARGGDLGWFGRGQMTPEFERVAFELSPGELSEPVLTPFGFHIIKVVESEDDRVRASHILIPITMGGASEDQLLGSVDRLEKLALRHGLQEAADSLGVQTRRLSLIEGSDFVPGIGAFTPVIKWAFHDSTLVGELAPVYETEDSFLFFELLELLPASYVPFVEAEPAVRRRLLLDKKRETVSWRAEGIARELEQGKTLGEVAETQGLSLQSSDPFTRLDFVPGIGQANAVIGTAFGLQPNEVAGPVEADGRFFFIQLVERQEANHEDFEQAKENLRAQLALQRQRTALDEWLADLRERANIEDWRQDFFVPSS